MKVLVTGNLGYIGTVLTPMLLEEGFDVAGFDSDLFADCTYGNGTVDFVETRRKDIRDVELADVQGFDAICHLAGLSNDPLGNLNPTLTYDINYHASVRLAELAKEAGVQRFVFSSSCSNYGAGGEDLLTEESPFNHVTPYGESKVFVERDVSAMADDHFSPTFLRNATAYGVSPRLRFDLVLNNLVAWAYTTNQVMLKSDGSPWRPIVHIRDIAAAFIAALKAPIDLVHNQAFNVGATGENYRVRQLAEIVAETVPGCRLEFAAGASPDKRCYRVSCDKIANVLKFEPKWTARRGAHELHENYMQYGLTLEEFEGPRYQRIGHIKRLLQEQSLASDLRFAARPETVLPAMS